MEFPRLVYADRAAASAGTGVVPRTRDEIAVELDQMVSTARKGCGLDTMYWTCCTSSDAG